MHEFPGARIEEDSGEDGKTDEDDMYRMTTRNGGGSVVVSTSNVKMHKSSLIKYVPIYFLYRMIKTTANTM